MKTSHALPDTPSVDQTDAAWHWLVGFNVGKESRDRSLILTRLPRRNSWPRRYPKVLGYRTDAARKQSIIPGPLLSPPRLALQILPADPLESGTRCY